MLTNQYMIEEMARQHRDELISEQERLLTAARRHRRIMPHRRHK